MFASKPNTHHSNVQKPSPPPQQSGFSAAPQFQEAINFLEDIRIRLAHIPPSQLPPNSADLPPVTWLTVGKMSERVGFELRKHEHLQIIKKLEPMLLYCHLPEVRELLNCFTTSLEDIKVSESGELIIENEQKSILDQNGWARATGKRKTATANVILKPIKSSKAEVLENVVNGKSMHCYFVRFRDLYNIAAPLKLTQTAAKYRVEAECRGGGPSGQSGALRLGIAKALVKADPTLLRILDEAGMLKRDARRVERKKPGQEKARRKFAWVKR